MSFLTGLMLGSLGGGLLMWVANRLYRRRRYTHKPAPLRELLIALELDLDDARTDREQIEAQFMLLSQSLSTAHANNQRLQNELMITKRISQRYEAERDLLQAQLTSINREHERVQRELTAAQRLTQQSLALVGDLEASPAGACFQPAMGAPGTSNGAAHSAEPQPETRPAAAERVYIGTIFDRDRLMIMPEALCVVPPKPQTAQRNPLTDINGIGPIYAQKLFDAGIRTLRDLAALTPERVQAIIDPRPWRTIDVERWIIEARQQSRPA
jgi:predicted flap endonuclease-1-like 5' DNA nuclease